MGIITAFLVIFIAALAIAHILLSVIMRGNSNGRPAAEQRKQTTLANGEINADLRPAGWKEAIAHEKVKRVDSRVDFIEKLLLQNGNSILAYNLKEKLRKLDNFRANTEVEIAGIKEILAKMQESAREKPLLDARNPTSPEESNRMHGIIYRSKHK